VASEELARMQTGRSRGRLPLLAMIKQAYVLSWLPKTPAERHRQ
jgi:hypothetical protein